MPEPALTVSQFVELVNAALANVQTVTVEGEVAEFKIIQNKWAVFDLKDERSLVKCFMTVWQLHTALEDGMLVRVSGQPKLRPKGFFSFVLESVQPAGEGSLKRAFELLRRKLEHEGLFAPERKRSLPRFPERIALITSRDAAAYGDFLKVLAARLGGLTIYFFHTAVQGDEAPTQIIQALEGANTFADPFDAIVMIRGGGNREDLQAFNDERVVRAVAASRVPTIIGIGHERDITLAELAADQRASTPSNAAELLVRTKKEITASIEQHTTALRTQLLTHLHERNSAISQHVTMLRQHLRTTLTGTKQRTNHLERLLVSLSPRSVLKRGFSITRNSAGRILKEAGPVKEGEVLTTTLSKGSLYSRVVTAKGISQLELGV